MLLQRGCHLFFRCFVQILKIFNEIIVNVLYEIEEFSKNAVNIFNPWGVV